MYNFDFGIKLKKEEKETNMILFRQKDYPSWFLVKNTMFVSQKIDTKHVHIRIALYLCFVYFDFKRTVDYNVPKVFKN